MYGVMKNLKKKYQNIYHKEYQHLNQPYQQIFTLIIHLKNIYLHQKKNNYGFKQIQKIENFHLYHKHLDTYDKFHQNHYSLETYSIAA
jgi:hypothetical protein